VDTAFILSEFAMLMLLERYRSAIRILLCLGLIGPVYYLSIESARAEASTSDELAGKSSWLQTLSYAAWHEGKWFLSGDQVQLTFSTGRSSAPFPIIALPGLATTQSASAVASFPLSKTMRLGAAFGFQYPQISAMGAAQGFTNTSDSGRVYGLGFIYQATRTVEISLRSERSLAYATSPLGTLSDTRAVLGISISFK
jgi:hypothetical protein